MAGYHGGLKLGGRRVLPYKPTPRNAADCPNVDLRPALEQKKLDQTLGIEVKRVRFPRYTQIAEERQGQKLAEGSVV